MLTCRSTEHTVYVPSLTSSGTGDTYLRVEPSPSCWPDEERGIKNIPL